MNTGDVRSMNNTAPLGGITSRLNVVLTPRALVRLLSPESVEYRPVSLIS